MFSPLDWNKSGFDPSFMNFILKNRKLQSSLRFNQIKPPRNKHTGKVMNEELKFLNEVPKRNVSKSRFLENKQKWVTNKPKERAFVLCYLGFYHKPKNGGGDGVNKETLLKMTRTFTDSFKYKIFSFYTTRGTSTCHHWHPPRSVLILYIFLSLQNHPNFRLFKP